MTNDMNDNIDFARDGKRLRIGIFNDAFFPMIDGVVNVIDNYAKRLSQYADVTVFVPEGREKFDDSVFPYKVVRCNKKLKAAFLDYDLPMPAWDKDFVSEIKKSDLDIVHIHSPFSIGKLGMKFAKEKKIPVVATLHSQFKKDFYLATKSDLLTAILLKNIIAVFNNCDECWAVNKEVAKVYFKEYKLNRFPKIQNNGTDLTLFENEEEIDELRKHYKIGAHQKILLFVGRINRLKNIFFTLDCLKILKDKNFNFKMIFVGTGPDMDEFKQKIHEYQLDDDVILTGKISDRNLIVKHYRMADLFVFPSLYDCSSLVQIEAASQKTPTIFIKGAVTSGTCTEGVDAFFAEDDEKNFAEKIIEIFDNPSEYEKIKNGAYNNLYVTWDDAVKKVYDDYLRVIKLYKDGYYKKFYTSEYKSHKRKVKLVINKERVKNKRYIEKKKKKRLQQIKKNVFETYKQDKEKSKFEKEQTSKLAKIEKREKHKNKIVSNKEQAKLKKIQQRKLRAEKQNNKKAGV
ncbi:MAG: glycosyltransferase [Christensenellales bacterium]